MDRALLFYDRSVPIAAEFVDQLRVRRADADAALEALRTCRRRVEEHSAKLESPKAATLYLQIFIDLFTNVVDHLDMLVSDAASAASRPTADALRRLASRAEREEPRCREFSDKWVQKPLPHEEVRPLLTQMVSVVRHQLGRIRALEDLAARIQASAPPAPEEGKYGRRDLFSRLTDPLRRRH